MKKALWLIAGLCLTLAPAKAQKTPGARDVLDRTAALFSKHGGVTATFKADSFDHGTLKGSAQGVMNIQGERFLMATPDWTTWYNGETQWSYMKANEEVNVSTPTADERQTMNPYTLVNLYKKGYALQLKESQLRGKPCYEITLMAQRNNTPSVIIVNVDKENAQPMCIRLRQKEEGQWTRISILQFQTGQSFAPSDFEFNHEDYPQAEVIDLR